MAYPVNSQLFGAGEISSEPETSRRNLLLHSWPSLEVHHEKLMRGVARTHAFTPARRSYSEKYSRHNQLRGQIAMSGVKAAEARLKADGKHSVATSCNACTSSPRAWRLMAREGRPTKLCFIMMDNKSDQARRGDFPRPRFDARSQHV